MYNFKKSLKTLAGVLVLLGITAAVTPFIGHGQDGNNIEPQATSDVRVVNTAANPVMSRIVNPSGAPVPSRNVDGPRGSNIVTLRCAANVCKRLHSTGAVGGSQFVVPANQVLIVTDVNWTAHGGGGSVVTSQLFLEIDSTTVYESILTLNSNSFGSVSDSMETGFAVAAGKSLSYSVAYLIPDSIYVHGYLVPAV